MPTGEIMRTIRHRGLALATAVAVAAGAALALGGAAASASAATPAGVLTGNDVSSYQGSVDWSAVKGAGASFTYVKATQGTYAENDSSSFTQQYAGAANAGLVRGAYHYADPANSSGAAQATYFIQHGGGWSPDGTTLPPMLDLEYSTTTSQCFGLSTAAMVAWIADFSNTMLTKTGIRPVLYVGAAFWRDCTGNSTAFTANPLFDVSWGSTSAPVLFGGWKTWTFWQYADGSTNTGTVPGDPDYFNGDAAALTALAYGGARRAFDSPVATSATSLSSGATLLGGQSIQSADLQYKLTMQTDGNLVLYSNGRALWNTQSSGNAGASLKIQTDGNAVVYSEAGKALWNAGTSFVGGDVSLALGNDGDLVVRSTSTGATAWRNMAPGTDTLTAGGTLTAGQYLHSADGTKQAVVQEDGNFVDYTGLTAGFNIGSARQAGDYLTLQTDGNLVVYSSAKKALWNSHTAGNGSGSKLVMQADGNLVLYTAAGKAVWYTKH